MSDYVKVKTLPQLAAELGLDRSTLVRLEQRGVIDKAPKVRRPVMGRVYDEALEKKVRKQIEHHYALQELEATRPEAPKGVLVKAPN